MKAVRKLDRNWKGLFVLLMVISMFSSCQQEMEKPSEIADPCGVKKVVKETEGQVAPPYIPELPTKFLVRSDRIDGAVRTLDWVFNDPDINAHYSNGVYFTLHFDKKAGKYFLTLYENTDEENFANAKWIKLCSGTTREVTHCAMNWLEKNQKCKVKIINDPVDGATGYGCCEEC